MTSEPAVADRELTSGADAGAVSALPAGAVEPFGAVGAVSDRGPDGRFRQGNRAALVAGEHSAAFWADVEGVLTDRRRALLADCGHTLEDAPQALRGAVDGAVQAVLLRDAAFMRVAESGGPTTLRGRRRAAFKVWLEAGDRAERYLRLLGLERRARDLPRSPAEALMQQPELS
jgi:hypothetical protein